VSPQKAYRLALVMIPLSIAVGIAAAIGGVWLVVVIMAFNLVFQVINFRASRRALRGRDSS
jgi:Zn-dependent membrane protease YugP